MATPFTNFFHLTQATSGATRNAGANGDMATLLNWACVTKSNWGQEFSTTNAKTLRPASGCRFRLNIQHDSAVSADARLATVRASESSSSTVAYTDPYPTPAQVADGLCVWFASNVASTTTRDFHIWVWETGVIYATRYSGVTDVWEVHFFGDAWSRFGAADALYNSVISVRNSNSGTAPTLLNASTSDVPNIPQSKFFAARDITGTIKSEQLVIDGRGSSLGSVSGAPSIRGGYSNYVEKEKLRLHAIASATNTPGSTPIFDRFCFPNLWTPLHNGLAGTSEVDTITDTAYDPSSDFVLIKNGSNGYLVENTNTHTGYPGG